MPTLALLRSLAALVVAGLLPGSLSAQQTWIVDLQGGAGSQFTEIQPAIDAAERGDLILVRPNGSPTLYRGFTVEKDLRIVGGPGVRVGTALTGWWSIGVRNLAAGEVVVIDGIEEVDEGPFGGGIVLEDNLGTVHFEDVIVDTWTLLWTSAQVSLERCALGEVSVQDSQVLLTETTAQGYYDVMCVCRVPALDIEAPSRVTVAGGSYYGSDSLQFLGYAGAAMRVENGAHLVVTGDFDTTISAGDPTYGGNTAILNHGALVLDPDPAVIGTGGRAPVAGSGQVTSVRIPYFHVDRAGTTLTTTVETWPGATVRLFYGSFTTPFPWMATTPDVWLGTPRRFLEATAPANGIRVDTFQLPPFAAGVAFPMQAVVVRNGQPYLSNPVVATVGG